MKKAARIEAGNGRWHWVEDHVDWIRCPECARSAGLPEEAVLRFAAMPHREANRAERTATLLEAMRHGLIRFNGREGDATFETTLPLSAAIPLVSPFMAEHFGSLTMVRFSQLPDGPFITILY
jgi:hypothetical protein